MSEPKDSKPKDDDHNGDSQGDIQHDAQDDAQDNDLWEAATRDVQKVKGQKDYIPPHPGGKNKPSRPQTEKNQRGVLYDRVPNPRGNLNPLQSKKRRGKEIDRKTLENFKNGKMPIDGRVDLHGMNRDRAFTTFRSFILQSYQQRKRCLLVITGKGKKAEDKQHWAEESPGVLRRQISVWIEDPSVSDIILKKTRAQPKHGGEGAFYILLRRNRE